MGGVIERDADGEPTGVLFENAQDLVRAHIPEASDRELREAMRQALQTAAAAGLTGIHNLEDARTRRAFLALEAAGMDADLVALTPDPFGLPAQALLETRVSLTMVGGRITFEGA